MRRRLSSFARATSGVAALEFALILPMLIFMMLGSVELQRYMRTERQLSLAAESLAALVAQRQAGNLSDLAFEVNSMPHLFPPATETSANWASNIAYQITSVVFAPTVDGCTSGCTYKANVAWVWPDAETGAGLGSMKRRCGALTSAAVGEPPTGGALPGGIFGPGSVIVVDLLYEFTPLFGATLVSPISLSRQGYANPQYASPSLSAPTGSVLRCSGY